MGVRLQRDLGIGMPQIGGHGGYVGHGGQLLRGDDAPQRIQQREVLDACLAAGRL